MTAYRDAPPPVLCPRCGDVLDHVFDLVRVCMQCEGVWLGPTALSAAFSDVKWPGGRTLWWRNSMDCPECKLANTVTQLTAMQCDGVLVDRCPLGHGVYLDRGELGRLMLSHSDELLVLLDRLADIDVEQLAERRERWKRARDARLALIELQAGDLEELAAKRRAAEAAEAARQAEEIAARRKRELEREAERVAARRVEDERRRAVDGLRVQRAQADRKRERLLEQCETVASHIAATETQLAAFQQQLAKLQVQIEESVRELAEIDRAIAALEQPPARPS